MYCEKNDLEDLQKWFCKRGYPTSFTKEQMENASRITPSDENNSKKVNCVPVVVTCNPAFKNLSQVIRKNVRLLYAGEQVKKVFALAPFLSFRSTRNLTSYLVGSKIYPLESRVGSEKCKRCLVYVCMMYKFI